MNIDRICKQTGNAEMLNALHACRENHPLNNSYQWRNALSLACQRRDISMEAIHWLETKAAEEAKLAMAALTPVPFCAA